MIRAARGTVPLPGLSTISFTNEPKVAASPVGKSSTNLLKLHRVGEWTAT